MKLYLSALLASVFLIGCNSQSSTSAIEATKPLTIVARIEANKGSVEFVKSELIKLIEPTLQENGCLQYDLHQDNQDPAVFVFFENWENRELWQAHMKNAHLAEYLKVTEGKVKSLTLNEMTKL